MLSDEPARQRRPDPAVSLLDTALRDGALILDAYGRFATALIGAVVFPYAAAAPGKSAAEQQPGERRTRSHRGVVQTAIALLIGFVLGRRLFRGRASPEA